MKQPNFHSRYRTILSVLLCAGLLCSQGCSFMLVDGPPQYVTKLQQEREPVSANFNCTESNFWPAFDTIWAGLNALGAASAMAASDEEMPDRGQIILVGMAWTVLSGAAAISGYSKTSKCRSAKEWQMQSLQQQGL